MSLSADRSAGNRPAQKRQLKIAHLFAQMCYGAAAVFAIILGNEILESRVHIAPGVSEIVVEDSRVEILLRG